MPPELLATYASTAPALIHDVPFGVNHTPGRTLFAIGFATNTNLGAAVPSGGGGPWTIAHSVELATVDARVWTMDPATNNGTTTSLHFNFGAGPARSVSAIVWEDDLDSVLFYPNLRNVTPTDDNPALHGTLLHTFPLLEEGFGIFIEWGNSTGPVTMDAASFDNAFTLFAKSAATTAPGGSGDLPSRIFIAHKSNVAFNNQGVTMTGNGTKVAKNVVDGIAGMLAYAVLTSNPPINMTVPFLAGDAITDEILVAQKGLWRNGAQSYTYQWQRNGSNISGATSSVYMLTPADEGQAIRCRVGAVNPFGTATLDTSPVTPVAPATVGDVFIKLGGTFVPKRTQIKVGGVWNGSV